MTPEQIMTEWIARLRSDNYYQIVGVLGTESTRDGKVCRCADGVLADILTEAGFCNRMLNSVTGHFHYDGQSHTLFVTTLEKAGIQRHWMTVDDTEHRLHTLEANDQGWNFSRIADALEFEREVRALT